MRTQAVIPERFTSALDEHLVFNLLGVDGRMTRVTPQEYQARLIAELTQLVPSLAEFREKWLDPAQRRAARARSCRHAPPARDERRHACGPFAVVRAGQSDRAVMVHDGLAA